MINLRVSGTLRDHLVLFSVQLHCDHVVVVVVAFKSTVSLGSAYQMLVVTGNGESHLAGSEVVALRG